MSLLLTDNASPGSSLENAWISGGSGGMEKLVIVVISLILLTESLDRKHVTRVYVYQRYVDVFIIVRVISAENALYLKNGLC